jgi:predicted nucleic acid-binding protein
MPTGFRPEITKRYQLSFYDANIVACAVISGAPVLLTEDMHAGFLIDGLKLQNPFKEILP